jgi:hypothetical protein
MSSKESHESINFQTVRNFTQLLTKNKKSVLKDVKVISEIARLITLLAELENNIWKNRAKEASQTLSGMTEEERRMMLMSREEKKFFLQYKKQHPDNPWTYFKEYQKTTQDKYRKTGRTVVK